MLQTLFDNKNDVESTSYRFIPESVCVSKYFSILRSIIYEAK